MDELLELYKVESAKLIGQIVESLDEARENFLSANSDNLSNYQSASIYHAALTKTKQITDEVLLLSKLAQIPAVENRENEEF